MPCISRHQAASVSWNSHLTRFPFIDVSSHILLVFHQKSIDSAQLALQLTQEGLASSLKVLSSLMDELAIPPATHEKAAIFSSRPA